MKCFTGWQYLLIDVANQWEDLDKEIFEKRIEWATTNLAQLEQLAVDKGDWKTAPLYWKAVYAIRKAQARKPTGHMVGFDATCSGIQMMSVLTGCPVGAKHTGLVDPDVRADAYTKTTEVMNIILGGGLVVSRKDAKDALMTAFYGSKAIPLQLFGEDTPELAAFYKASRSIAPGAWDLLTVLLDSWQSMALQHSWKLPDGFNAIVKVMDKKEARIVVDELGNGSFTHYYKENTGLPTGHHKTKSNAANVVHSVDAYVLRCIHRRCNYNPEVIQKAHQIMVDELDLRGKGTQQSPLEPNKVMAYYINLWKESGMPDVVILNHMGDVGDVGFLSTKHLTQLVAITTGMLLYTPFEVVTIHDEFKCGPNHMNHLRQQYINIMAELAESTTLAFILSGIYGKKGKYTKVTQNLGDLIRKSNYALC